MLKLNQIINENNDALNYLNDRGINKEWANKYLLGYIPETDYLVKYLINELNFDPLDVAKSKIAKINKNDFQLHDYFTPKRIIFPVFENGRIVTISSRSILEETKLRYKTLKISKVGIFNIDLLKQDIPRIYIAEGAIDCITMNYLGFPSIGVLGANSFGLENVEIFKQFKGELIFLFDNDQNKSGTKGARKIGTILYKNGITSLGIKLLPLNSEEKKKDINECLIDMGFYKTKFLVNSLPIKKLKPYKIRDTVSTKYEKKATNIYLTITSYGIKLIREGNNRFQSICPFSDHTDSEPSFKVYEDTGTFKCFGCGRGGDAIEFVREYEGVGFTEALSILTQKGLLGND